MQQLNLKHKEEKKKKSVEYENKMDEKKISNVMPSVRIANKSLAHFAKPLLLLLLKGSKCTTEY